jgi:hypothetical protein
MKVFEPRALSHDKIDDDFLAKLQNQEGFFLGMDGVYHYAIMLSDFFRLEMVLKDREEPISKIIKRLPWGFRVVVNGNYFKCVKGGCYAFASVGNVTTPDETDSIGKVVSGGRMALEDTKDAGDSYAYFGRNEGSSAVDYVYGMGNPSVPPVHEGAGGLGPLILTNPVTKERVRYGKGNLYEGVTGTPPKDGDPKGHWDKVIQRNNNTYASMNSEVTSGMGAIGVSSDRRFLIAVIKPHDRKGTLDSMRDKLWDIGVNGACFLDGSNSVFMAVDREMVLSPARFKDNLIEVGFGFRRYDAEPAPHFGLHERERPW